MNNNREAGKLPNILEVVAAMEKVHAARPLASSEPLWWNDPKINHVLNAGVLAGHLSRPSTTQVEWTESGAEAVQAARAADRKMPEMDVDFRTVVPEFEAFGGMESSTEFGQGECSLRTADRRFVFTARIWANEPDSADDDRRAACELELSVTDEQLAEKRTVALDAYEYRGDDYGAHLAELTACGALLSMWRQGVADIPETAWVDRKLLEATDGSDA